MKITLFGFALITLTLVCCTGDQTLNPVLVETAPTLDYSAGIFRTTWRHASRPTVINTAVSERAHIAWYNPIDQIPIEQIWPNRQVGQGENSGAVVLSIQFKPVDHKYMRDTINNIIDSTSFEIEPENSWGGFMRSFHDTLSWPHYRMEIDLEEAQYFEVRLRGDVGIMHIDLGLISEDIDGDGRLDTEDLDGYRILDDEEDVGLDLLPDPLEFGYDPENGVIDPTGDNFDFNNIWRINGTEGNREDPDGGYMPDTEDPDFSGLETTNSYFSYRIDLSDTIDFYNGFYMDSTRNEYNWRTLCIPLRDPMALNAAIGSPSWDQCRHMRIWFDSASAEHTVNPIGVQIASMRFVSTGWNNATYVADSLRGPVRFEIGYISEETDQRYTPPPGVDGYYDQMQDVIMPNQSLLLIYEGLNAGMLVNSPDSGLILAADTGIADRILSRAKTLTEYRNVEAYVHGDIENDSVLFFFRMGAGPEAYFQYQTVLKPGWNPDNYILFNLIEIELMKTQFLSDRRNGIDSSLVRQSGKYLIKVTEDNRAPNINLITYFAAGVINLDETATADGEVWIHGLRQTGHQFFD